MKSKYLFLFLFLIFFLSALKGEKIDLSMYNGEAIKKLEKFLNGERCEVIFNEKEINDAINENKEYFPHYLKDFHVFLFKNSFLTKFYFYKSALKNDGTIASILSFFLKDKNEIELLVDFYGGKECGKYEIEYLRLNGFKISSFLVNRLVSELLEKYKFPFKPDETFLLPFNIRKVILSKGYIKILK